MLAVRRVLAALLVIACAVASSCSRDTRLTLRYLPGIMPNTEHVLPPRGVVVMAATGAIATSGDGDVSVVMRY